MGRVIVDGVEGYDEYQSLAVCRVLQRVIAMGNRDNCPGTMSEIFETYGLFPERMAMRGWFARNVGRA